MVRYAEKPLRSREGLVPRPARERALRRWFATQRSRFAHGRASFLGPPVSGHCVDGSLRREAASLTGGPRSSARPGAGTASMVRYAEKPLRSREGLVPRPARERALR